MNDEERLRLAGWSPNSLALAMDDFGSPLIATGVRDAVLEDDVSYERLILKRTNEQYFGSPQPSFSRGVKVVEMKETPNFRGTAAHIIDLSVSTIKKAGRSEYYQDSDSDAIENDDDVAILTQNFRRQSIEVNKHSSKSREDLENSMPPNGNVHAKGSNNVKSQRGPLKSCVITLDLAHTVSPVINRKDRDCAQILRSPHAETFGSASETRKYGSNMMDEILHNHVSSENKMKATEHEIKENTVRAICKKEINLS